MRIQDWFRLIAFDHVAAVVRDLREKMRCDEIAAVCNGRNGAQLLDRRGFERLPEGIDRERDVAEILVA